MSAQYLPIIDLSRLRSGDAASLAETARAVDAVCRESGFFYIVGHGLAPGLTQRMFAASRAFFEQTDEVKQQSHIRHSAYRRGFEAIGHQSLDPGKPTDLLEAFNIGLDFDLGQPGGESAPRREEEDSILTPESYIIPPRVTLRGDREVHLTLNWRFFQAGRRRSRTGYGRLTFQAGRAGSSVNRAFRRAGACFPSRPSRPSLPSLGDGG